MREALYMASDALGLYLYTLKADKKPFPPATDPADIEAWARLHHTHRMGRGGVSAPDGQPFGEEDPHHSRMDGYARTRAQHQLLSAPAERDSSRMRHSGLMGFLQRTPLYNMRE